MLLPALEHKNRVPRVYTPYIFIAHYGRVCVCMDNGTKASLIPSDRTNKFYSETNTEKFLLHQKLSKLASFYSLEKLGLTLHEREKKKKSRLVMPNYGHARTKFNFLQLRNCAIIN